MRRYIPKLPEQQDERQRRNELQQELRLCAQAEILLLSELLPVIQKADSPEHQRKQKHKNVGIVSLTHGLKAYGQAHECAAGDENNSAHGRSPRLGHMPGRAVLTYLLSRFHFSEPGDIKSAYDNGDDKRHHKGKHQLQCHYPFLFSICSATISRSSMWRFSWPTT